MHYDSPRGLVALMPGLIRGVARYYRETLSVKVKANEVHITFPSGATAQGRVKEA
jgi:hypothetical protein